MGPLRLAGLIATLFAATLACAVPADIDASFGTSGQIGFPVASLSPFALSAPHTAVLQPDGKLLVVAGITQSTNGAINPSKISWQIRRYTPEGLPDAIFGVNGSITVSFDLDFGGFLGDDYAQAIALLPDGRFLVAGESLANSSQCFLGCSAKVVMARFNGDGSLDPNFGNSGKATADLLGADAVAIQNDGKILTGGNQIVGRARVWYTELHRFNVDGSRDPSFVPSIACGGNGTFRLAPDGKIVIVTNIMESPGVCITRLNADGTLDIAFGTLGKTIVGVEANMSFSDFFVDGAGAITVVGGTTKGVLFRLAPDGMLDTTFGVAGIVESDAIRSVATGIGDCSNRTIIAAPGPGNSGSFSIARLLSNGAIDIAFGGTSTGFAQTNTGGAPIPIQLLLRPNGRIVVLAIDRALGMLKIIQYQGDAPCGGATGGTIVEFYNINLDTYFLTANPNEAAAIDTGSAGPGWSRSGDTFKSGGNTAVCRFYGSLSPGPNSHFYTLAGPECNGLIQLQASTSSTEKRWNFESLDFISTPPSSGNGCPTGTVPVYRAYNNGFARGIDSNHRISTSQAAIAQVVARGWKYEGVVMCAPV
jgi:uncharacterized delta-60 repeat protein